MNLVIGLVIGLVGGGAATFVMLNVVLKSKREQAIREAELEAENIKKKNSTSKREILQIKRRTRNCNQRKERRLQSTEDRAKAKEKTLSQKIEEVSRKEGELLKNQTELEAKVQAFEVKHSELEKIQEKRVAELSKISGMSVEDAKNGLMEALKDEARTGAMAHIKEITEEAKLNANREAKKIVIQTIQRVATEQAVENAVSVFNIDSDEVKGRIIGREGRNIRALKLLQVLRLLLTILLKLLSFLVLTQLEERLLV